jgi:phosphoribosylformimino-5-aminoimidazole carboxamide ribonucleotide (ProFAR) isomerase
MDNGKVVNLFELLKKARNRDANAMLVLLNTFRPKLINSLKQVPPHEREDLEQELKIDLIQAILRYEIKEDGTCNSPNCKNYKHKIGYME